MMKRLLTVGALASVMATSAFAQQRNCATMEVHEAHLEHNHEYAERLAQIEENTARLLKNPDFMSRQEVSGVISIPVVVHVVYNNSTENISQAQIQSQIDVLNEDFRATNSDVSSVPALFAGRVADMEIEFVLDKVTRTSTSRTSFGTNDQVKFNSSGGKNAEDTDTKLNMWVCDISGGILGYAQFPGGAANTDGVVIDYQYFGNTGTATAPYDGGRTATHEVGHWLNLRHIWGDGGCSVDDFVSDTPLQGRSNGGCPSFGTNSCGSGSSDEPDMFMNYMDYVQDDCMYMFSSGQKARLRATFEPGGGRESFVGGSGGGGGGGGGTTNNCGSADNTSASRRNWNYYTWTVDPGTSELVISISGGTGDADLYVRQGSSNPTTSTYDCRPYLSGNNETCTFANPQPGTWKIGVRAYSAFSGVDVNACNNGVPTRATLRDDEQPNLEDAGFSIDAEGLTVYPNPVQGVLNLELNMDITDGSDVVIYSLSGAEALRVSANNVRNGIDVSSLQEGMYLISVEDDKHNRVTTRFIKQ